MARQYKFDETRLKPKQREVALALVEREFAEKKERKTKQKIAEEHGITAMTLWRWNNEDPNFIAYKNHIASQFVDTLTPFVYAKMVEGISAGNTKLIELFLKRLGDLDTKTELTVNNGNKDEESQDERLKRLRERLAESESDV